MDFSAGLLFLALSVVCSVSVGVLLKVGRTRGLDARQAILVNYGVASALCASLLTIDPAKFPTSGVPLLVFLALGVLLPSIFMALARSVQHAGIVRTDAAQRLSLIIPLLSAFLLFGETLTTTKLAGIALAFAALLCLLMKPAQQPRHGQDHSAWLWPLVVLLGYGVIDVLFKQMAKMGGAFPTVLLFCFMLAGVVMLTYLLFSRVRWHRGSLLTGLLLGVLNFANIYTYLRAHQTLPGNPALVFSAMNMGVITLGTLVGAVVFRERLQWVNWLGVGLALLTIFVMMP